MELGIIIKALFALGLVFTAMYIILKLVQKYTRFGYGQTINGKNNLKIENVVYVDESNKIVNISNNNGYNYVIAFGRSNSFLIDKYKTNNDE